VAAACSSHTADFKMALEQMLAQQTEYVAAAPCADKAQKHVGVGKHVLSCQHRACWCAKLRSYQQQ
jgi:hypothetical protein